MYLFSETKKQLSITINKTLLKVEIQLTIRQKANFITIKSIHAHLFVEKMNYIRRDNFYSDLKFHS